MQGPSGRAVIATDDDETRRIARNVRAQLTEVSATRRTRYGVQVIDGRLHVDGRILGSQADWPNLQGPHNAQNAAAAVAACRALGLPDAAIASAPRGYRGLPHRMARVKEKGGLHSVNDTKETHERKSAV